MGSGMARGQKTQPKVEEEVFAEYLICQSYSATGRTFNMPVQTVFEIVERLSGDRGELGRLRNAMRADMIHKSFGRVDEVIDLIRPDELGTEKSSRGLEAARAVGELGRFIAGLEPKQQDVPVGDTIINISTGMKPPPELEYTETTTTTLVKPS